MPEPINISTEEYREYRYADGSAYRINAPRELYVFEGKTGWTTRVVDAAGVTHRPEPGWIGIAWKPRPGAPAFVA